jgi:DMSO/TMAO reductase YedYZ heme-binding membrane subunit
MFDKNRFIIFLIFIIFLSSSMVLAAQAFADDANQERDGIFYFSSFSLIKFFGICALVCVSATFLSAMFRRKLARRFLKIHRALGWLTVIFALIHGLGMLMLF